MSIVLGHALGTCQGFTVLIEKVSIVDNQLEYTMTYKLKDDLGALRKTGSLKGVQQKSLR